MAVTVREIYELMLEISRDLVTVERR